MQDEKGRMEATLNDSANQPQEIPDDSQPRDRGTRCGAVRVEPGNSKSHEEPESYVEQVVEALR
jgi:hypothetical protein